MDFPKPPVWYSRTSRMTPPPAIPANQNIRSFGFADFEEKFWKDDDLRPIRDHCEDFKYQNRQIVRKFARVVREVANDEGPSEPPEKLFAELAAATLPLREALDKLRIYEARRDFAKGLRQQILDRQELATRLRKRMATVLHALDSVLLDEDHTKTEQAQFGLYEQQQQQKDDFIQRLTELNFKTDTITLPDLLLIAQSHLLKTTSTTALDDDDDPDKLVPHSTAPAPSEAVVPSAMDIS